MGLKKTKTKTEELSIGKVVGNCHDEIRLQHGLLPSALFTFFFL